MYPYLRLGPFLLQLPLLALLVGVWIGSALAEKEAVRLKLPSATINNLVFIVIIAGIVGARLAYAARYLSVYLANPLSLFALNFNTMAGFDGVLIGLVFAALYGWRKKLPLRPTLDALAPGLAAFMVALSLAHTLSGDAFGAPANLPWSIYLWNEYRHPSQVYETLAALAVLFVAYKKPFGQVGNGTNFLLVVALLSAARIFLEAFRGDSLILLGGFRAAQVIGLIVLAITLYTLRIWTQTGIPTTTKSESDFFKQT
ncbi:MAG TPA: prolipoprotein diacylglyceryl transferase family protein [Anaerolineales bacterium]|nr:prolipoprotein diacylglyceryl transferase family protein [Anaerolineales bacterium]